MMKKLLLQYVKDRLLFILFYVMSTICLISFFNLEMNEVNILYPLLLSLLLFILFCVFDWGKYYEMNKGMNKMLSGESVELKPHNEEQKNFLQLLNKMNKEHAKKYMKLKDHYDESMYFLSHFMHHLKTPVSVIDLILENESTENEAIVEKIRKENKRLYASIEHGLTMLRIDHFEKDLEVHSVELLGTLRKIINEHRKECIYHSIYPIIKSKSEKLYIATDEKWNEVMLNQIITNAMKYSSYKDGKKQLVFYIEESDESILLSITDEGIGIPEYDLPRIFDPFFTGENGRKFPNSSGIGLYICKKIADQLGIFLSVQSTPSKGTTVQIQYQKANDLTFL